MERTMRVMKKMATGILAMLIVATAMLTPDEARDPPRN